MACKRKDAERCRCYWNDDLSPLIDRFFSADALLIGSPIYFGEPTSQFRALLERLIFSALSYEDRSGYYKGKVNVGILYTMNAPAEYYESGYRSKLKGQEGLFKFLNGEVRTYAACDTLQVKDSSKYSLAPFSEADKKEVHEKQFPVDLKEAYRIGAELSRL